MVRRTGVAILAPPEGFDLRSQPVVADDEPLPAPVADEGGGPAEAGGDGGDIVLDHQPGGAVLRSFGRDRDHGRIILLAGAVDEDVARDPADGAVGEIDQVVGPAATAI